MGKQILIKFIFRHESSVWQISWSHPRYGNLFASCGFDKKAIIWKENSTKKWDKIFEYDEHKNSVNCLEFAPNEYGLILLCGSSDGFVSIHEYKNENWSSVKLFAHGFGVNGVSWGHVPSASEKIDLFFNSLPPLRFVSCGVDNLVKIFQAKDNDIKSFHVVTTLEAHDDIVKDVAWRSSNDSNYEIIASGGNVKIYMMYFNFIG